jgi:multisubunit Na+/H+ antiporter MnhG subunit
MTLGGLPTAMACVVLGAVVTVVAVARLVPAPMSARAIARAVTNRRTPHARADSPISPNHEPPPQLSEAAGRPQQLWHAEEL